MNITNPWDIAPIYDREGVTGRRIIARLGVEIIHMSLEPGACLAPHRTPFDVQFFVHRGPVVFLEGEREIPAAEGAVLDCPGHIPHGMRNDSASPVTVLVIKHLKA